MPAFAHHNELMTFFVAIQSFKPDIFSLCSTYMTTNNYFSADITQNCHISKTCIVLVYHPKGNLFCKTCTLKDWSFCLQQYQVLRQATVKMKVVWNFHRELIVCNFFLLQNLKNGKIFYIYLLGLADRFSRVVGQLLSSGQAGKSQSVSQSCQSSAF